MMSVQANKSPYWKKKIERGFFRGRDSRQERLDLTVLSRKNTNLLDVGLTNFFFFEYDEKKYGPKHKHISFFDFFKVGLLHVSYNLLNCSLVTILEICHYFRSIKIPLNSLNLCIQK